MIFSGSSRIDRSLEVLINDDLSQLLSFSGKNVGNFDITSSNASSFQFGTLILIFVQSSSFSPSSIRHKGKGQIEISNLPSFL